MTTEANQSTAIIKVNPYIDEAVNALNEQAIKAVKDEA